MPWNAPHAGVALGAMTDMTWNAHYVPAMPRFFLCGLEGVYGTGGFLDRFGSRSPRHPGNEQTHTQAMMGLRTGLMTLRDSMNPTFGAMIQAKINQYPNDTHLIACGWAHLVGVNPLLQSCIQIGNIAGIVDRDTRR